MAQPTRRQVLGMTAAAALAGGFAGAAEGAEEAAAAAGLTFEVYADARQEFRWRLKAGNGQIIGTSGQGYKAKADCKHAIDVIVKGASTAKVVDDAKA